MRSYPNKFQKKCNGLFFDLNPKFKEQLKNTNNSDKKANKQPKSINNDILQEATTPVKQFPNFTNIALFILFNIITFFIATIILGFLQLLIDPKIYVIPLSKIVGKDIAVSVGGIICRGPGQFPTDKSSGPS